MLDDLNEKTRRNLARANGYHTTALAVVGMGKRIYDFARERFMWTLSIEKDDDLYDLAHDWLLSQVTQRSVRQLSVRTKVKHRPIYVEDDLDGPRNTYQLVFHSDDNRTHKLLIDGHKVSVTIDGGVQQLNNAYGSYGLIKAKERMIFETSTLAGKEAVLSLFRRLLKDYESDDTEARKPEFRMVGGYGGWERRNDLPLRTLDTVILDDGIVEDMRQDMNTFLESEDKYIKRSIPWHRGWVLHGAPGTGKTSVLRALATDFALDVYYLPLGDLSKDATLLDLVAGVKAHSMLILEDVDVFLAATSRGENSGEASLSGLLNALDGLATPHGLVTCMTTNNLDMLDKALLRPGRMDRLFKLDYCTDNQAERLFELFYERKPHLPIHLPPNTSPADVTGVFKQHLDDAQAAERALCSLTHASDAV